MLKFFVLLLAITGLILCIFIGYDIFSQFNTWQRRIGIGRFKDKAVWSTRVFERAAKWLHRSPTVPKDDYARLILWDKITSNSCNTTIQSWQTAGIVLGLNNHGYTFSATDINHITTKYSANREVDAALLAYALLSSDYPAISKETVLDFADKTFKNIIDVCGTETTIPYRKNSPKHRYVDTLGFVCPFLVKYSILRDDNTLMQLAQAQLDEYYTFFHQDLKLPPHAYNLCTKSPMGVYDWGRGIGWYILALIESRRTLLTHNLNDLKFYQTLTERIVELADTMLKYQKDSGGFAMFVTNNGGQYESSATVLAGLLFVEAYAVSKAPVYCVAAEKTIDALMAVTQRNGAIDLCQGDTKGIGLYSTRLAYMPFVQGLTVLLANRYVAHA